MRNVIVVAAAALSALAAPALAEGMCGDHFVVASGTSSTPVPTVQAPETSTPITTAQAPQTSEPETATK